MTTILFRQSDIEKPYEIYETMLSENPVYWDEAAMLWAIYSYEDCRAILNNPVAQIPPVNREGLNDHALLITDKLARLNNNQEHEIARAMAMSLFENMQTISIAAIVENLLDGKDKKRITDWVKISRKLPVMAVLESFGFDEENRVFIAERMEQLVKIMLPGKTAEQIAEINEVSKQVYETTGKHFFNVRFYDTLINQISGKYKITRDEVITGCVSNLVGLFIQSYDAGRGILSNTLLQLLRQNADPGQLSKDYLQKTVIETLRHDPPVHNTRRIAADTIVFGEREIKKGQRLFIVLAAANRDPKKFADPNRFDIHRQNNKEHLTFGTGHHACVAGHFSMSLATDALEYVFNRYPSIRLLEENINYEPAINVRLPKSLLISLT